MFSFCGEIKNHVEVEIQQQYLQNRADLYHVELGDAVLLHAHGHGDAVLLDEHGAAGGRRSAGGRSERVVRAGDRGGGAHSHSLLKKDTAGVTAWTLHGWTLQKTKNHNV